MWQIYKHNQTTTLYQLWSKLPNVHASQLALMQLLMVFILLHIQSNYQYCIPIFIPRSIQHPLNFWIPYIIRLNPLFLSSIPLSQPNIRFNNTLFLPFLDNYYLSFFCNLIFMVEIYCNSLKQFKIKIAKFKTWISSISGRLFIKE